MTLAGLGLRVGVCFPEKEICTRLYCAEEVSACEVHFGLQVSEIFGGFGWA